MSLAANIRQHPVEVAGKVQELCSISVKTAKDIPIK